MLPSRPFLLAMSKQVLLYLLLTMILYDLGLHVADFYLKTRPKQHKFAWVKWIDTHLRWGYLLDFVLRKDLDYSQPKLYGPWWISYWGLAALLLILYLL